MPILENADFELLLSGLGLRDAHLTDEQRRSLAPIAQAVRTRISAGERLPAREGWVAAGWAFKRLLLTDGRRQIVDFILPGDFIDPSEGAPEAEYRAVTQVSLAKAGFSRRLPMNETVAKALERVASERLLRMERRLLSLGRRTALERLSRLMLELEDRCTQRGLATNRTFALPLTQEMMGDALGLSIVHVNRTLQQMRRLGVIKLDRQVLTIVDIEELAKMADLQPSEREARPMPQLWTFKDGSRSG